MNNLFKSNLPDKNFSQSKNTKNKTKFSVLLEKKENTISSLKEVENFLSNSKKLLRYIKICKFFK